MIFSEVIFWVGGLAALVFLITSSITLSNNKDHNTGLRPVTCVVVSSGVPVDQPATIPFCPYCETFSTSYSVTFVVGGSSVSGQLTTDDTIAKSVGTSFTCYLSPNSNSAVHGMKKSNTMAIVNAVFASMLFVIAFIWLLVYYREILQGDPAQRRPFHQGGGGAYEQIHMPQQSTMRGGNI